jgi:hypothetical protein
MTFAIDRLAPGYLVASKIFGRPLGPQKAGVVADHWNSRGLGVVSRDRALIDGIGRAFVTQIEAMPSVQSAESE